MEIYQRNRLQDLAIVILNYNSKSWFELFLKKILEESRSASIYIIDNASTDDSLDYLQIHFPTVTLIKNFENKGYAGGYNHGLKQINKKFYCLLNSDVEITSGWIEPILKLFDKDSEIAAIQPKILSYYQKDYFEFAGAAGGFIDNLGYPFCRGRIFFDLEKDQDQYNNEQEIFWASGACLFIRRKDFWEEGGFDETFFAHMEEIDLCWRLKNKGKKIYYCGQSTVYHIGGGTLNANSPQKTYLNFRNNLLMLIKNLPSNRLVPILSLRLILDGIAGIRFLFSNGLNHSYAIMRAHFSVYKLFFKYLKKRKSNHQIYYIYYDKKQLLYQYFFKNRKKYSELK